VRWMGEGRPRIDKMKGLESSSSIIFKFKGMWPHAGRGKVEGKLSDKIKVVESSSSQGGTGRRGCVGKEGRGKVEGRLDKIKGAAGPDKISSSFS